MEPTRFLLDQNFPKPPGFDPHVLDRTVTYEHFSDRWPQHAKVSTPDWLLCLLARSDDFDGVVTLDRSQLTQSTEAVALALTKINVVTWSKGDEDPVVLWGQLLAYMPQVCARPQAGKPRVFTIPNPRLGPKHVVLPNELHATLERRDGIRFTQRRREADRLMRIELDRRGLSELAAILRKGASDDRSAANDGPQ